MARPKSVFLEPILCRGCGKFFQPKRRESKVCSPECVKTTIQQAQAKYSEEDFQKAIALRLQGKTRTEISKLTGINKHTLTVLFHERGVKLTEEQKNAAISHRWDDHRPVVDGKKNCVGCKRPLPVGCFTVDNNSVSGLNSRCRECCHEIYSQNSDVIKKRNCLYAESHEEQRVQNSRIRYLEDPERFKDQAKDWAHRNPEKRRAIERRYNAKNPGAKTARTAAYRANLRRAVPIWLSREHRDQIKKIYAECPKGFCVDHIVPLAGEDVSGLHVPWNLQYLPARENEQKCNKFDPFTGQSIRIGVCHQKIRRDQTESEDRSVGMPFDLKVGEFKLQEEPFGSEHRIFIKRYEWLGNVGFGNKWCFTARHNGLLAGVVLISQPTSYSSFGKDKEALIQRGAVSSWAPRNLNSRLVMFACRWMVQNTSKRLFVAYSDPQANEIGTIYQACNFDYLGAGYGAKFVYKLPDGRLVGQRCFTRTGSMKRWAKELGIEWLPGWTKPNGFQDIKRIPAEIRVRLMDRAYAQMAECEKICVPSKGKYAMLLGVDRREQRELNKLKTWTPQPYPKREQHD